MRTSRIAIIPGVPRDLTYIAANMSDADWHEVSCQLAPGVTRLEVAWVALQYGAWVATIDGQPVACFGFAQRSATTLEAFAWGTDRMSRAVPAITRFIRRDLAPGWFAQGVRRLEARSLDTHEAAHRWMTATGAVREAVLPDCGRDGEDFILFAWRRRDIEEA